MKMIHVLIVEDVDTMRELLRHTLDGAEGLKVTGLVGNGWEARVELTRRRPDLVLLDEILPGESALDLLEEFTKQEIPVILLTGLENATHEQPPQALGRIVKPGWKSIQQDRARISASIQSLYSQKRTK